MATFYRQRAVFDNPSGGGKSLFTFYWDSAGGTPASIATEAAARVRAFFNSMVTLFPNSGTATVNAFGDEVEETNGQIVGTFVGTPVATVTGTGSGDFLPMQTQGLLRLQTGSFINGRRVAGRIFLPNQLETFNTGGAPLASWVTAVNTAAALLGTTVVTPIAQRVWHRPGPAGAGLSVVVTGRSASTNWAILKSRR